jgi:putative DNA primase/helicase
VGRSPANSGFTQAPSTDFNDQHVWPAGGLDAVRCQVEASLTAKGWSVAAGKLLASVAPAQGAQGEGGGEREAMRSIIPLHEAAERFALVYGGKGALFDFEEHLLVPKADVLDILPEHGWRDLRAQKRVVRLDEVGFDPAGTDTRIVCNLWGGWPTVPKEGKCSVLLELLEYLCSGEKNAREIYHWVLKWLAYPIQHPGAKMKTALVFHGPQGTGKNLFFESVMQIYGEYGRVIGQECLEDKFTDWASRKLFLIADEVVARQELFHTKNKLKGLITSATIRINPKNVSAHEEMNHVNMVFLSNEQRPLVLEKDDRRYTVIYTPEKLPKSFYEGVATELAAGGVAALHHHLLTMDLGDFAEHTEPPMTQAKRDLIEVSLGSTERFHADWEAGETPHPFCPCASSDLYLAYKRWCGGQGIGKPREQTEVISYFGKLSGWFRGHADRYQTTHYTGESIRQRFVIPSQESLEQAAKRAKADGDYRKPDGKTKTQWLTDCFWAFKGTPRGRRAGDRGVVRKA